MMKIGINTLTYDLQGSMVFEQDAKTEIKNNTGSRRVSRTATLDGGAVAYDSGYSASDRNYTLATIDKTGSIATWAERLVTSYTLVKLITINGVFEAIPEKWRVDKNMVFVEFLIMSQVA
jgi:hypothetical protein